jgi:hypothetical protein
MERKDKQNRLEKQMGFTCQFESMREIAEGVEKKFNDTK